MLGKQEKTQLEGIYFVISLLSLETTTYVKTVFMGLGWAGADLS